MNAVLCVSLFLKKCLFMVLAFIEVIVINWFVMGKDTDSNRTHCTAVSLKWPSPPLYGLHILHFISSYDDDEGESFIIINLSFVYRL
jgi:hypothetical protein